MKPVFTEEEARDLLDNLWYCTKNNKIDFIENAIKLLRRTDYIKQSELEKARLQYLKKVRIVSNDVQQFIDALEKENKELKDILQKHD